MGGGLIPVLLFQYYTIMTHCLHDPFYSLNHKPCNTRTIGSKYSWSCIYLVPKFLDCLVNYPIALMENWLSMYSYFWKPRYPVNLQYVTAFGAELPNTYHRSYIIAEVKKKREWKKTPFSVDMIIMFQIWFMTGKWQKLTEKSGPSVA